MVIACGNFGMYNFLVNTGYLHLQIIYTILCLWFLACMPGIYAALIRTVRFSVVDSLPGTSSFIPVYTAPGQPLPIYTQSGVAKGAWLIRFADNYDYKILNGVACHQDIVI